ISTRWSGFDAFARRAPYASGAVIILVGIYMGVQGFIALSHPVQHAELPLLKPTVAALSYSL
ncbi:hypothetical protein ABTM85_21235, partial [Acinetobacter baumannii]